MAITATKTLVDRLHGLTPLQASGKATGTMVAIATAAVDTVTVRDQNVTKNMIILATIQSSPDNALFISKAVASDGQIVFTIHNTGTGNSGTGSLVIAYIGV